MARPIVIIHGWSDHGSSFRPLAEALRQRLGAAVSEINLAEWESTNDQVTYDDLITQMDKAWTAAGLSREPYAVDVIVHSTGGLVIRDWLLRNFGKPPASAGSAGSAAPAGNPTGRPTADNQDPDAAKLEARLAAPAAAAPPVKHLVMLAPANFGSPLAHKGTSLIGRVVKGWNAGEMFQVGALVLKGLELGSTYTWNLAQSDRFGGIAFYDAGKILTTVLVGNEGYSGVAAAANEPGSDGTVRVSTANMNAASVTADLTDPAKATYTYKRSSGRAAFRVLDGLNHATVHDVNVPGVLDAIIAGLEIDDAGFMKYCDDLDAKTRTVVNAREADSESYHWGYANAVFFVRDQFFKHVTNYFIEFFNDHPSNFLEDIFHRKILQDTHPFSDDNAYRAMLIDTRTLREALWKPEAAVVKISLTAEPEFSINKVGYRTFNDEDIAAIELTPAMVLSAWNAAAAKLDHGLFTPNETVFIELILRRDQRDAIFGFNPAPK